MYCMVSLQIFLGDKRARTQAASMATQRAMRLDVSIQSALQAETLSTFITHEVLHTCNHSKLSVKSENRVECSSYIHVSNYTYLTLGSKVEANSNDTAKLGRYRYIYHFPQLNCILPILQIS